MTSPHNLCWGSANLALGSEIAEAEVDEVQGALRPGHQKRDGCQVPMVSEERRLSSQLWETGSWATVQVCPPLPAGQGGSGTGRGDGVRGGAKRKAVCGATGDGVATEEYTSSESSAGWTPLGLKCSGTELGEAMSTTSWSLSSLMPSSSPVLTSLSYPASSMKPAVVALVSVFVVSGFLTGTGPMLCGVWIFGIGYMRC